jgi:acetolactate synthase-1/2/3 large subunit
MAYGHYLMSGKPQAVLLHVNVGTANATCALMNAYRERIPLIVAAGRTPLTETGHPASRSMFIHWAQEMFDQGSLVRETVKWDYEVSIPEQIYAAIDRAVSLATSEPKGPVYLTLPREMLTGPAPSKPERLPATQRVVAEKSSLEAAAMLLAKAKKPLIVTASVGQNKQAVAALASLATRFAIPVVSHVPKSLCLPTNHPMHLGYAPGDFVSEADVIVVLECDVPWIPMKVSPQKGAKVIHIGQDPLFARYGIRNFPCETALPGDPALTLPIIEAMMSSNGAVDPVCVEQRRKALAKRAAAARMAIDLLYDRVKDEYPIHPAALTRAINRIKRPDDVLINELGIQIDHVDLTVPGTYFQQSAAGGLGWGLGAALGVKLAAPDRFVIAAIGDGSYMFGNPTPAHYMSQALGLPILFVVTNNGGWGSVRSETNAIYPEGYSATSNDMPLTTLQPMPHFERVVEASGGYGERVERIDQLQPALERAAQVVKVERRQALVNVICRML